MANEDLICIRRDLPIKGETLCGKKMKATQRPLTQWLDYFTVTNRSTTRARYCETCFAIATGERKA